MKEMRAKLTVTADASAVITELNRAAGGLRDMRREGETSAGTISQSAKVQQASLEAMAAAAGRAASRQDDLVAAERRAIETRRQARSQEKGLTAIGSSIDDAVASVFANQMRSAETAADSLRQVVGGMSVSIEDAIEDMMAATVEAREYGFALDEVRRVLSPLYAESKRYEETLDAIGRAERISAINANEAAAARERAARAMAPALPGQGPSVGAGGDVYAARTREQADQAARAYQALEASLDPVIRAQRELAQAQGVVNRALAAGQVTHTAASQTLQQLQDRYEGVVRAQSPAAQSAHALEIAIEQEAQEWRQLTLAMDPALRAQAEMQRAQELTARAVRLGITTQEEATRMMGLFEARQKAVGSSGLSMGMGIQNASYQIADFAVQVQAGQAASLALAQQLPQLLGGFGVVGAILGAVVAVGAPLAKMWLTSGDAAGTLDDRLRRLETSIGSVADRLKLLRNEDLSHTFGTMTAEVRSMTEMLLELDRAAQLKTLRETNDKLLTEAIKPSIWQKLGHSATSLLDPLSGMTREDYFQRTAIRRENYQRLTGGRGPSFDDFEQRRGLIEELATAGEVKRITEEIARLMAEFRGDSPFAEINSDLEDMLKTLGDTAIKMAELEANSNESARTERLRDEGNERLRIAQEELGLAQVVARYGEDSKQAEAERTRIAREAYELELDRAGILPDQRERLLAIHDAQQEVNRVAAAWADRMADVRAEIGGILSSLASLGGAVVDRAARAAELQALNAGQTVADAAARGAAVRREAEQNARLMAASGPFGRAAAQVRNWWDNTGVAQQDALDAARAAARDRERETDRKARGGGGAAGRSSASAGASIMEELARLKPSYDNDVAAAEAWREKALEGLNKTRDGYAKFATDVELIYQERLQKAYEDDLKRREDWAAGVERGLIEAENALGTWADTAEELVTGWAKKGEDAFVRFGMTGKASIGDMVDFMLEQFLRLAYQQNIAPAMNMLAGSAAGWLGSILPGAAAAPISTNHTGSPGVMRSYAMPGFGDRMRPDEQVAMIRDGEEILTSRALENAGALIANLSAIASRPSGPAAIAVQPAPMQVNVHNYGSDKVEADQGTDSRGGPTLNMTIGRQVAGTIRQPGNPAARAIETEYGVRKRGIPR